MTAPASSGPALVVLAAGMGSRYGGLKQLDPVGPGGATLMDYALFDARRTGFGEAVFIIRPEMEEPFRALMAQRFGTDWPMRVVLQKKEDLPGDARVPPERVKPWGTAHAVLAAARAIKGSFAVVNGDDFYGFEAYEAVSRFLAAPPRWSVPDWALVGYRLRDTVSAAGGVNRGLCRVREGRLDAIEEVVDIVPAGDAFAGTGTAGRVTMPGDALVSMNMWGFTAGIRDILELGLLSFVRNADLARDEYLLPTAIQEAARGGAARITVLDPGSRWIGLTHQADRPGAQAALARLVADGRYPERLW